jgi:hydroxypyruvate reductase
LKEEVTVMALQPEKMRDLEAIYTAAINAVNPAVAVSRCLQKRGETLYVHGDRGVVGQYNLRDYNAIIVVGAGKATAPMAKAVEDILGDRIDTGCVCVKEGYGEHLSRIEIIEASHPVPDARGRSAALKIREILGGAGERDLVISLISGGGSALLPLPPDPITLEEKRSTTELLLRSGASIHEVNAVRKHLSLVKGGNFAKAAMPAAVINLMISDVVGDDIDVIASGPFAPDNSTFREAWEVLGTYGMDTVAPSSVVERIRAGAEGRIEDNPRAGSQVFAKVVNRIIASNIVALNAAKEEATKRGYHTLILSSMIEGDTRDAAFWHSRIAREVSASSNPVNKPACIVSGGETTVAVAGDGLGGRNMEFAMQAALFIDGAEEIVMASVGSDGTDGPTDAAGAAVDGSTAKRAREIGVHTEEFIARNDSYHFHQKMGTLIMTGPTNTNVMDIRIMLIG